MALVEFTSNFPFADIEVAEAFPMPVIYELAYDTIENRANKPGYFVRAEYIIETCHKRIAMIPSDEAVKNWKAQIERLLNIRTEQALRKHVALLLGCFPNARPTDPEVYVQTFLFDVFDMRFSDAVVALACRDLRRSLRFPPTIEEFVSAAVRIRDGWRDAPRAWIAYRRSARRMSKQ